MALRAAGVIILKATHFRAAAILYLGIFSDQMLSVLYGNETLMPSIDRLIFPTQTAAIRWRLAALRAEVKICLLRLALKAGFDPNQPRAPAGQSDGGQWTDSNSSFRVAQAPPRTPTNRGRVGADWTNATPAQQARLVAARANADAAIARVRKIDPAWRPRPNAYETIEGEIAAHNATLRQAHDRLGEYAQGRAGIGPYAGESIPLAGPSRNFSAKQRREIDRIGAETGCHTCGTRHSGISEGRFIIDHQPPNALNRGGNLQRGYPHCVACSQSQGGLTTGIKRSIQWFKLFVPRLSIRFW